MNYRTYTKLQFRPLLKNSLHSLHIDLRDTSGEQIPILSVGIIRFVLMFKKPHTSNQTWKTLQDGCFKTSRDFIL